MNEPQDTDQAPAAAQYLRLPVPVIAGALVVLLVVLLGLGLYANANLRPQGIVVPTEAVAAAATTPTAARIDVIAQPTAALTATPTAVVPAATAAPTIVAATATPELTPTSAVIPIEIPQSPTPRPTVSPELQAEVSNAYQNYWQVRAEALYELDSSHLQDVMAGDHLADAESLIAQLQSEGHAIRTSVSHQYVIVEASNDMAKIADSYVDNSVFVDSNDHTELSKPTGTTLNELYVMNRLDGQWKVVSLSRTPQ